MDIREVTQNDRAAWANLIAVSFTRVPEQMVQLWDWLQMGDGLVAWGAWDGEQLVAQYSCLLTTLLLPDEADPVRVGMSVNMAVHPDYRGRGLIKQVSHPVYEALTAMGGRAGVGFSNAAGVKVDRHSKGYGYQVVGKLVPHLSVLLHLPQYAPLTLTDNWPHRPWLTTPVKGENICFGATPADIRLRFAEHPFRRYQFGVWEDAHHVRGVVVYRPIGVHGVSLLGVFGEDTRELLGRWQAAVYQTGVRFIHCLTTPTSSILSYLHAQGLCLLLPWTRSPYYLTVKCLDERIRPLLTNFERWDCMGGDIL